VGVPVEGILQNLCARQLKAVAKSTDTRSDYPKILGDEGQRAKLSLNCQQEVCARTRDPFAGLSRRRSGGDMPGSIKSAEVVQPDDVHMGEHGTHAREIPPVAIPAQCI